MFHPPQAAIGLALLPVAWAANERSRSERGGQSWQEREADLARYFPPGWHRETVPDWPVAVAPHVRGVASHWQGSGLGALLRRAARRMKGLVPGFLRG
jgi:hypothetical protein